MGKKRILVILSIIFILLLFTSAQVSATNPYMGGYFNMYGKLTTNSVLLKVNFETTDASQIPCDSWLAGLTSVAGANGLSPTGYVYQNGVALECDNRAWWRPQAFLGPYPQYMWSYPVFGTDSGDYAAFYARTNISSGILNYKLYVYRDQDDIDRDRPYITYTYNRPTTDSNFLVGITDYGGTLYKHFQFGVESFIRIEHFPWEVLNDKASFYYEPYGIWLYTGARVCWHDSAWITWWYSWKVRVGKERYLGVNTKYTGNDIVCWQFTGTIIPDNSVLWYAWGQPSQEVTDPYE